MKIYKYENYDDYVNNQIEANHAKLKSVYVEKKTIKKIYRDKKEAARILCHGTRNAAEQKYFKKYFRKAEVIGTELSDTADQFPMTVRHDFNEVKEEWLGAFDIVYSNAIDHAFDPNNTIRIWAQQLAPSGRLYLEHGFGEKDNRARAWDPVEIDDSELRELFTKNGLRLVGTFESTGLKGRVPSLVDIIENKA
jgi:SAM-dependent methyltransferase